MNIHLHRSLIAASVAIFVGVLASSPVKADGDGEKLFKRKCGSCHKMDKNAIGPMLGGVIGRKAGSTDFGKYKALEGADFVWDEAKIDAWITNPKKFIGKATSMAVKIKKPEERAAIIAYLKTQ
jgi:cytochrome c